MNNEKIKIIEENKSIMLKISPPKTKRPLINKRKEQNNK